MNPVTLLSPAAEYEPLRGRRQNAAEQQIAFNGRCFLLLQLTALGAIIYFESVARPAESLYGGLITGTVFWAGWLFSLFFAGRAAFVVAVHWNLLEFSWWAIGVAPWALLMVQMTFVGILMVYF